jgi:hypothetical protein
MYHLPSCFLSPSQTQLAITQFTLPVKLLVTLHSCQSETQVSEFCAADSREFLPTGST